MRLNLLGPPELVVSDRSLDIGGSRRRVILAMLGLNANRVTPLEDLIDAIWDINPPTTARGQVQTCISALRKLLTDAGQRDVIRTHPAGYILETSESSVDIDEFTRLINVARGLADDDRTAAAAATLRSALGLWRGPAMAGVDSRLVRRRADLLEHRRLGAIEERVRLDLQLGWHREIVGELEALVDEHPLREELCGYLMLALYRSDRQAEALEVYRRAHAVLAEELAIEPGPQLRELERAILNRDPALDLGTLVAAPSVAAVRVVRAEATSDAERAFAEQRMAPHLLPWGIADFTGRDDLIARISALVTGPVPQHTAPIVVVTGRGGVGKSSLAIRVAHELIDLFPDGTLYADVRGAAGEDGTGMLLARFLRALGINGSALPDDLQQRADLYRTMLANKRLLVLLDEVTDEDQVLPLLPGGPNCTVIVTSRVRLSGLPGAAHVEVGVLDTEQSVELITKIIGPGRVGAESVAVVELVRFCEGLPLALRIAGGRLASRPHWRVAELVRRLRVEARRLDEFTHRGLELRSNIGLSYRALSPGAHRLFGLLALVETPDFPGWTAAALLDTDLADARDLLETLVEARMLDVVRYPGEQFWYRFHDLVRVYARERLAEIDRAEQDAALVRMLGAWLALAEDAHRKEYGGDYTILCGRARRWRPADGDDALAFDDPLGWLDHQRGALVAAIQQAATAGLDEMCWDLALTSVTLFEVKGYFDHWRETSELGLRVTTRAGNSTGQAAMLYSLGTLHMFQKRLPEAERFFQNALALFNGTRHTHGRALVLRNLALVDGMRGRWQAMLTRYDDALALMRAVGDRMGEVQILRGIARFRIDEGERERPRTMLAEALRICQEVHCLRGEAQVVNQIAYLHLVEGEIGLAHEASVRVLLIVRNLGDRIGEVYALHGLGRVQQREGRHDRAETTLQHALALARRVGERLVEGEALYALGEIDIMRVDHDAAATRLAAALGVFEDLASALWQAKTLTLLAQVALAENRVANAADRLRRAAELLDGLESQEAARWLTEVERTRLVFRTAIPAPTHRPATDAPGPAPAS